MTASRKIPRESWPQIGAEYDAKMSGSTLIEKYGEWSEPHACAVSTSRSAAAKASGAPG